MTRRGYGVVWSRSNASADVRALARSAQEALVHLTRDGGVGERPPFSFPISLPLFSWRCQVSDAFEGSPLADFAAAKVSSSQVRRGE